MGLGKPFIMLAMAGIIGLSGCASKNNGLMHLRSNSPGPDEFAILPTKQLVQPKDYASLPAPTPGGTNVADPTPRADAVKALGGNPAHLSRSGIPSADSGIVNAASRYGVRANIREELAIADAEFRRTHKGRLLERLFKTSVYFKAYAAYVLDRFAELERLRRLGIRTPAAPPDVAQ